MTGELTGKRVLVTGATGFIGGRLVERLDRQDGVKVRVLVRNLSRLARLARFDIEIARGDVTDRRAVETAAGGCDVVVHCAYGSDGSAKYQSQVNVEGTRNVIRAAVATGSDRVVHVSTVSVYGVVPEGEIDESTPHRPLPDIYSKTKAEGEKVALALAAGGAPVTVVQPTIVYGPFAPAWTVNVLEQLTTHRVMLIDGGQGICNAVYIDDLVDALLLAAARPGAVGEAFLISGPEPVTWRRFYRRYEEMLDSSSTLEVRESEVSGYRQARRSVVRESLELLREDTASRRRILNAREPAALLRLARKVVPESFEEAIAASLWGSGGDAAPAAEAMEKPVLMLDRDTRRLFAARSTARIDKARRTLGYEPRWSFDDGMRLTEAWARWANLLPPSN